MLYLGIDIGKRSHSAALLSRELLAHYKSAVRCPRLSFDNDRAGFERLLELCRLHGDPADCSALLEHTGHYGAALEQYLQEHGMRLYRMQHAQRYANNKTDELDARALAVLLYNQQELRIELADDQQRILPLLPPTETARELRGLTHHRFELESEITQRKNKLTAICDEIFPELTSVYVDPNTPSALALREAFPTPEAVAGAELAALIATRTRTRPGNKAFARLQELAATSIGSKDTYRIRSLILEQSQLIAELRLLTSHVAVLDERMAAILADSREGKILQSFPGIGQVHAATLLAGIGTIANFESVARLKTYLGWGPRRSQTGTTYDSTALKKRGKDLLKSTMYLATMSATVHDPTWGAEYAALVERLCPIDAKTGVRKKRMKAIGHVAGHLIKIIYTLLKQDLDAVQAARAKGVEPPDPVLYDPARHSVAGMANAQRQEEPHRVPARDRVS